MDGKKEEKGEDKTGDWFPGNTIAIIEKKNKATVTFSFSSVMLVKRMCNFPEKSGRCYLIRESKLTSEKRVTSNLIGCNEKNTLSLS